jgi:VIT1/CCC1 family predicted Fe2+/Mn2+ transporter
MAHRSPEHHSIQRVGWLRAAVLGANDGLLSTASLIIGVASASTTHSAILIAGAAGLIAGAMSMAAGEYVSVSSQHDAERADLGREAGELKRNPQAEEAELAAIYLQRGLDGDLSRQVARQLMAHNPLEAHARDELGLSQATAARPLQAALVSAASFAVGAAAPLALAIAAPHRHLVIIIAAASLMFLAVLGALGARAGKAPVAAGAVRVTFWGALAMLITAGLGRALGAAL